MAERFLDSDAATEKVQLDLLQGAGAARRAQLALSLTGTVIGLARRAIRRSLLEGDEREVCVRFVELHYGRDLAAALRRHLSAGRP
jgi:hypothetical protein